jgi:phosphoribosylaminoimidazolecarboxamide formyltransferase / IMP cyclohydrolase
MRTALLSVSNKTNLSNISKFLLSQNVKILSTGGTYAFLKNSITNCSSDNIHDVASLTNFPEILGGRVKTLHPVIHGGILAKRHDPDHINDLKSHNIGCIDIVIANLYPFSETVNNPNSTHSDIIENIDIGGHTLIRAAAKNYNDVVVVTCPEDYDLVVDNWDDLIDTQTQKGLDLRKLLASKAWNHIVTYDMAISSYFNQDKLYRSYDKVTDLKYGLNPQQKSAALYRNADTTFPFTVLSGNLGYINTLDAIYGWNLVDELSNILNCPAVASYKHNSPAGVAISHEVFPLSEKMKEAFFIASDTKLSPVAEAYIKARNVDPMCSFGDFLSISGTVDVQTAKLIASEVSDGIIARDYDADALDILKKKKQGNYVILKANNDGARNNQVELREMHNVTMVQSANDSQTTPDLLDRISKVTLSKDIKMNLIIANTTLKYTQSNSVASALYGQTVGVGAGQQSRIDCVNLVKRKTENWILRQHPKCLEFCKLFVSGTKRTDKINMMVEYINGSLTNVEEKLTRIPDVLTVEEKREFLQNFYNEAEICLASDAFFPFRDNIDVASTFGTKYILQPGGSTADNTVEDACNEHGISMLLSGKNMRMFLH